MLHQVYLSNATSKLTEKASIGNDSPPSLIKPFRIIFISLLIVDILLIITASYSLYMCANIKNWFIGLTIFFSVLLVMPSLSTVFSIGIIAYYLSSCR